MNEAWQRLKPGQEVRIYRQIARLSQDKLAKKAGVNKETIVRLEAGENVRLDTLDRVKEALFGKPRRARETVHLSLSDQETKLVHALRSLPPASQELIAEAMSGESSSEISELIRAWSLLSIEERRAFRMLLAGRLEERT